jgi:hypothetical protein
MVLLGKESVMRNHVLSSAALLTLLALPLAACQSGTTAGVRSYVVAERRPSIRVSEEVMVGQPLPPRVRLYSVPPTVGLRTNYSYTVVNDQTVLVDPQTRTVVQVIE